MSEPVLSARGLTKSYSGAAGPVRVLRELDLDVNPADAVAVVGDSGVGKSTLLHLLGGLDRAEAGEIRFRGVDLLRSGVSALAEYRNRSVGFIFQFHHLLPEFTAIENVEMPFHIGRRPVDGGRVRDLLARMGLEGRAAHRPGALSGGEQQRVAIARALAPGPEIVLADEPMGNLDPGTGASVFGLLRELQAERKFALVVATHSGRLARGCERVLRLQGGRLRPMDEAETEAYFGMVD